MAALCGLEIPEIITIQVITFNVPFTVMQWGTLPEKVLRIFLTGKGQFESFFLLNSLNKNVVVTMHRNYPSKKATEGPESPFFRALGMLRTYISKNYLFIEHHWHSHSQPIQPFID